MFEPISLNKNPENQRAKELLGRMNPEPREEWLDPQGGLYILQLLNYVVHGLKAFQLHPVLEGFLLTLNCLDDRQTWRELQKLKGTGGARPDGSLFNMNEEDPVEVAAQILNAARDDRAERLPHWRRDLYQTPR
ncbi:hypothetical protein ACFL6I_08515 [candidate division KSB1 bacterium]